MPTPEGIVHQGKFDEHEKRLQEEIENLEMQLSILNEAPNERAINALYESFGISPPDVRVDAEAARMFAEDLKAYHHQFDSQRIVSQADNTLVS